MAAPRLLYAANRRIGVRALELLRELDWLPVALLVPDGKRADGADAMRRVVPNVPVLAGNRFRGAEGLEFLRGARPDYILSVHFPHIFPKEAIQLATIGTLNLHPAYLPYNRGWHTPSWAIVEGTPYGATLHWVDEGTDSGDILIRRRLEVRPSDTAHALYERVLELELEVLREAIPLLLNPPVPRTPQEGEYTLHRKADLRTIQRLDRSDLLRVGEVLDRLRGLTTNRWDEAAYFEIDGTRYRVRVEIASEADLKAQDPDGERGG